MNQMKNNESRIGYRLIGAASILERWRTLPSKRMNKMCCFILFCLLCAAPNALFGQKISISARGSSLEQVLKEIRKQSGYNFFLNAAMVEQAKPINVQFKDKGLEEGLVEIFKNQPFYFRLKDNTIIIFPKSENDGTPNRGESRNQQRNQRGKVVTMQGQPIAGVTVKTANSQVSVKTDADGTFNIPLADQDDKLYVSFVGMETQVVAINAANAINIIMQNQVNAVEDVVVTGLFNKSKATFTGSANSFTGEQLKALAPTNVIEALTMLTPGLIKVESNATGSNPNRVPDILLRGVTSFANNDQSVNQPLIIRDGTIVSLQDLYDMNINEIASITVLKDASAAALYGAKAANGVIVIERNRIAEGKIRISYNLTGSVQFPDFSDYNILDASQKLEFERLAGLYTSADITQQYGLDSLYNARFKDISRGVNTDWMAQPSRVGYTQDHSLRLSGGSTGTRYELNTRFAQVNGVMKGDFRKRYGMGFVLEHYAPKGFSFTNRTTLSQVDSKNSPYGAFSSYTQANPYDRIYDQYGELNKLLSWDQSNPLYEASIGSYDKSREQLFSNDFDARWNINKEFRWTTHWNITLSNNERELFTSPLSAAYRSETDYSKRGSMTRNGGKGISYAGNTVLSYNKMFDENLLTASVGGNITKVDTRSTIYQGVGFYASDLSFIDFAAGYPATGKPTGSQDLNADLGTFLNLNYSHKNRYYVDGVYQISGSSKFGANNRYGHFWSTGIGWNIHNEPFLQDKNVDLLKLRASMGYTGKVNFPSYQALTTYQYRNELGYLNGIGAVPMAIGNPNLSWERNMNYNVGTDISFLDRRFNIVIDAYLRRTTDLLIDKTLAPSTGAESGKDNLGEIENKGIEFHADAFVYRNQDLSVQLGTNIVHNQNKILKISNALKAQNESNNNVESIAPLPQFQEGESTTAIKVVQSHGIDPATGQEVYIKRNGDLTFVYDPIDKVVIGDQLPKFSGNFFTNIRYKQLSFAAYFNFTNGGYVYNTTRATKIEGTDPYYNADIRVFEDRWTKPGDIAMYKDIKDSSAPKQTSRFVEKENTLQLQRLNIMYDFNPSVARRIGASKMSFGISMNDLFRASTVRMERGTAYLYSRGVDFNLNILF